jgi:hypothetical protein
VRSHLHATVYMVLHNLLNALVQIANKMGLEKNVRCLPVTTAWCVLRNGIQLWRVAGNILNVQPRTNDKGWSSRLGVGSGDNNPSL